ncbi:MAG TPA: EAL domain-containing protein [Candidatus Dormibacteraeota bacterium]|nr:EAL domain-containing protein [Candidatus Dormibacteraeota bacterium]
MLEQRSKSATAGASGARRSNARPAGRTGRSATPAAQAGPAVGHVSSLGRIAAQIAGRIEIDDLFQALLDHAEALFATRHVGLWTYGPGPQAFHLAAARGLSDRLKGVIRSIPIEGDGPGLRAIRAGRVIVTDAGDAEPELREAYAADGIRTVCIAPIVFGGEPLGVLAVHHTDPWDWSPSQLAIARAFADQVAAAMENARLYGAVRDLARRLEAIGDLSLRLNRLQTVTAIGEAIVAEARTLIDHDSIRVYRIDHAEGWCEPIAFQGTFPGVEEPTVEMLRLRIGEGMTGWVAEHNEAVRSGDAATDQRTRIVGIDAEPESLLVVPMTFEERVRGVVAVSKTGRDQFTTDDEATLSIFAAYAAQALVSAENAERASRSQAELEEQLGGQRRLLEITERLVSARDPREVLEMVADALKRLIAYDTLTIYRVDRERGVRRAVVARDRFADVILGFEAPLNAGLSGWVVEHGEAVLANDAHLDPRTTQIPGTPFEPESMIVVPLLSNGEVVGTLNVGRIGTREAHFSAHEFELTKLFAGQASLALQNAEAHRAAERRARHDALTGLRNHGAFQQDLSELLAATGGSPLAVLMLDLDSFKVYNDTHGHPAGDRLLRKVADAVVRAVRDGDRVYRYGGDEFAVIVPGLDRVRALEVADRIRGEVASLTLPGGDIRLGMSVGVGCFPEDGRTKDALVSCADLALYLAKPVRGTDDRATDPRDAYLAALNETALALMDRLDARDLLEAILARATALLGTPNGYIYVLEPAGDAFVVRVGVGAFADLLGFHMPADEGLAGLVRSTGRPQVVADYDSWPLRSMRLPPGRFGSVAAVPLTSGDTVIGVLGLATGDILRRFGEREVAARARLGQLASIALDNARLLESAQREVAERGRAEAALRASEERFRRLSDAAAEALAIHRNGRILEVNQSFRELFGCTDEEAVGRTLYDFLTPGMRRVLVTHTRRQPDEPVELIARARDGSVFPVVLVGRTIPYPDGAARVASIRDLRERRTLEERLARQARTDRVTGLPNREELGDRLSAALSPEHRHAPFAALVLLDIDRFKVVNERLGHAAGDELLSAVGRRLVDALRPGDTVARFGGDEFAVLVEEVSSADEVAAIGSRLADEFRLPFDLHGRDAFATAHMGVVLLQPGTATPGEAFRDAEIALHRAKADPTGVYALFDPTMSRETLERLELEADLRGAIHHGDLRVHYQPIVDLATGRIEGVEALARWDHPTRGPVPTAEFIALAEESGLILPLGRSVLEQACRQARAWQLADPDRSLTVNVNLSARQFLEPDIAHEITDILTRTGLDPARLELEITESILMDRSEAAIATLRELRALGVRLALDDFGTGYSSLAYLKHLPLDSIKVDRTFIAELGADPAAEPIVSAVVSLAHGLGIEVVAEGIETAEQLEVVTRIGCDHGQGFVFARPAPADVLEPLLSSRSVATAA